MEKSSSTISKNEILEAIEIFSNSVSEKFEKMDERLNKIESNMVTKEYLDQKIDETRVDLEKMIRGTDDKVKLVSEKLTTKKVFTAKDHKDILRLRPFAETI
jgi:dihydroxyacetone kinase-like predicted kinase